jgi:hypothetical protein
MIALHLIGSITFNISTVDRLSGVLDRVHPGGHYLGVPCLLLVETALWICQVRMSTQA